MDLLGSILDSMDAPPKTENKEEKEKKRKLLKIQKEERKKKAEFRTKIEKDVNDFIQDEKRTRHKYPPMNKIQRTIVHDVAEVAGLTTFSFGEDEVDRYVMLFKKEFPPPDEELEAYRNGEVMKLFQICCSSVFICGIFLYVFNTVPSENKRDLRSIEETLNDIRKRKKAKVSSSDVDDEP
ncbi:sperm-associated antigen 7 homolog [Exaiptasia diaphana]|uniref:R3H domain-containing protein n=1 Tax=Exaiptasia diaphana TaxID=2652724 RepID=A0A913Y8U0_EXADI|nr:sperm-associated antigen 7 homolog [Exaiptasia diaphana]